MAIEVTRSTEARAPASGARSSQDKSEAAGGFGAVLGAIDAAAEDQTPDGSDSTAAQLQQAPRPDRNERAAGKADKADKSDKPRRAPQAADEEGTASADAQATAAEAAAWLARNTATQPDAGALPDAQTPATLAAAAAAAAAAGTAAVTADVPEAPTTLALNAATPLDPQALAGVASEGAIDIAAPVVATAVPVPVPAAEPTASLTPGAAAVARADGDAGAATTAAAAGRARAAGVQAQAQSQIQGQAQAQARAQAGQQALAAAGQPETQALQQAQAAQAAAHAAATDGAGRAAVLPADLVAANAAVLAATTGEFASGRTLPRAWETRMEEARTPGGSPFAQGAASQHALSADATLPVATGPIGTAAGGMEERMDAQMSYWLSQKTHNAELTLDTADGRAVEVSIALNGNEAQVAFRADQASTRELLGSALPQLREAMDGQGMLLAGVTVDSFGTRGQSGEAGQDDAGRQGRGGAARRTVALGEAVPAGVRAGVNRATQAGGLDLYV